LEIGGLECASEHLLHTSGGGFAFRIVEFMAAGLALGMSECVEKFA